MHLKDTVIIVTGASDGIGKDVALRLASEGVTLALIGRNQERLQAVESACMENGATAAKGYVCDISQSADIACTISEIVTDHGRIDVLINNAGVWQKLAQIDAIDDSVIDAVIDTNLKGMIFMTKYTLPHLRAQGEAIILNISSKSGVTAQDGQTVYTASKYGVRGFTEVLKADLRDTKIRVAGIYQSGTNTGMFAKSGQDFPVEEFSDPRDLADIVATMLMLPPKIWLHDVRVDK